MARADRPHRLLISDLDDTLLGDDAALSRFRAHVDAHPEELGVVYASGRFCDSIDERIANTDLPEPLATIGGVGSEIWSYPEREPVQRWWRRIGADWDVDAVRAALADVDGLEDQPPSGQSPYKISYYYHDASDADIDALRARLDDAGLAVRLIYSSGRDLDVLPRGVDKGAAAVWLAAELGYAPHEVMTAGNSMNDEALLGRGFAGIVVSNSHDELKALAADRRAHVAEAGHADGVLEGIEHWRGTDSPPSPREHEGYRRALDLLRACAGEHGFWASSTDADNYRRIWSRDGCITGLAALLSGDDGLIDTTRRTLETLAGAQGPHGEIPSNVDAQTGRISYGGTAGRVDADLWFVLGCGEYWRRTGDDAFLDRMLRPLERVRHLLGAWEFNNRGLLYVPPTGDWADEYLQSGYVLYDQLLYLEAQKQYAAFHRHLHGAPDHELEETIARLANLICANYWFLPDDSGSPHIYHEVLYEKGRQAAPHRSGRYWMPFFTPFGYGYRFDSFANTLVGLLGVSVEDRLEEVDAFIDRELRDDGPCRLLPAFWPVITPVDEKWDDLQTTFTYAFKNRPYEFHNGGLWPMVTGFYAASLARRGHHARAREYLESVHAANAVSIAGEPWSFPEFLHGRTLEPGGTHPLAWSAAGAVIAARYLEGERLFGDRDDTPCEG